VGLDAARVIATFGVIWVHAVLTWFPGAPLRPVGLGRFGTAFYIALTAFLALRSGQHRSTTCTQRLRRRAQRLLVPFFSWSLVYGLLNACFSLWDARSITFGPQLLLSGTVYHLWFLPFALVVGVVCQELGHALARHRWLLVPLAGLCAGLALFFWVYPGSQRTLMERWGREVPLVAGVVALSTLMLQTGWRPRPGGALFRGALLACAGLVMVSFLGSRSTWAVHLAGLSLLLAAWSAPAGRAMNALAKIGQHTFSIYLSHVVFLALFRETARVFGIERDGWYGLAATVAAFGGSLALAVTLGRLRALRFLFP
jgi:surface polysaccharide O-acyltransferase-like enzyme